MVKVLFVCLGNICRSPTAEGVFRHVVSRAGLTDKIQVDSAGTGSWHIGKSPDPRAQAAAKKRGIDLSALRGRQVTAADFQTFDYILAMDYENHQNLSRLGGSAAEGKLYMFLDFAPGTGRQEVPDPYYGAAGGFEEVLDLIEAGSKGLLDHIQSRDLSC